jgi:hypothetical protein
MSFRICRRCGVAKPLNRFAFTAYKKPFSRRKVCRECYQAKATFLRRQNPAKFNRRAKYYYHRRIVHNRLVKREWFRKHRKSQRDAYRRWQNSPKGKEWKRQWRQRNLEKGRAYNSVSRALGNGTLKRPSKCRKCKRTGCKITAHHYAGYAPENHLRVWWLCHSCHNQIDRTKSKSPKPVRSAAERMES